jgi:hypothetical protein
MVIDGVVYVLQGLAHIMPRPGQLAAVWREHDHFASRVVARYRTKPGEWIRDGADSWLVVTVDAIWRTSRRGSVELVARLPRVLPTVTSLVRKADGTLYLGTAGGALRLTPRWDREPRYLEEILVEQGSEGEACWMGSESPSN